jgi:predicted transcriptional regulator
MFMDQLNLGAIEFAVSRAIPELHEDHDYISARQIADHIGCERTCIYRAIRRLKAAGRLQRLEYKPRNGGSKYHVKQ